MSKPNALCHDLKTERPDVGQPLPAALRLLPFAFYLTTVGAIVLTAYFYFELSSARAAKESWIADEQQQVRLLKDLETVTEEVKTETRRAEEIAAWVEGSRSIQELCLAVSRSMDQDLTISRLSLERQKENPAQIQIGMELGVRRGTDGPRQLDQTLDRLDQINYRSYGRGQTQKQGVVSFTATLLHQAPLN
ncbi:hypothetical protein BH23VER1_BH23VER1_06290 [soil metagenome]